MDDTMIVLASADSIPPLLRVLERFEAMSNHRMNISKTMMLLLGRERGFDLRAAPRPARYGGEAYGAPMISRPARTIPCQINGTA